MGAFSVRFTPQPAATTQLACAGQERQSAVRLKAAEIAHNKNN